MSHYTGIVHISDDDDCMRVRWSVVDHGQPEGSLYRSMRGAESLAVNGNSDFRDWLRSALIGIIEHI